MVQPQAARITNVCAQHQQHLSSLTMCMHVGAIACGPTNHLCATVHSGVHLASVNYCGEQ